MININRFLHTIYLVVIFGMISEISESQGDDNCKVKFPNGFYCNYICEKWGVLPGKTFLCLVSRDGTYHNFVARYPTFGVWRFFYVNPLPDAANICQRTLNAEEFHLNDTEIMCNLWDVEPRSHKRSKSVTYSPKGKHDFSDIGAAIKRKAYEGDFPLDAVCSLAATQVCKKKKMIHCRTDQDCCFTETNPQACNETLLAKHDECYKVLDSIFRTLFY